MLTSPLSTKLTSLNTKSKNWEWKLRTESKARRDMKKRVKDQGVKLKRFTQAKIPDDMTVTLVTTLLANHH